MRDRSRLLHHTVQKISKFRAAKRQKRVKQLNNTLVKTYKLSSCALSLQFVQILKKERAKRKSLALWDVAANISESILLIIIIMSSQSQ